MRIINQEIPTEQKEILDNALKVMQQALSITKEKDNYLDFDIITLRKSPRKKKTRKKK